jgi:hypothetical protein
VGGKTALQLLNLLRWQRHSRTVSSNAVPDFLDQRQALLDAETVYPQSFD